MSIVELLQNNKNKLQKELLQLSPKERSEELFMTVLIMRSFIMFSDFNSLYMRFRNQAIDKINPIPNNLGEILEDLKFKELEKLEKQLSEQKLREKAAKNK